MSEAERVRRIYNRLARTYEPREGKKVREMRRRLFSQARGEVLELGVGAGATFAHYPNSLSGLTAVDVSERMLARAEERAKQLPFPVTLQRLDFQRLPFGTQAFDTVTSSLALCGVPDPVALFAEIRRVLRPGGKLLALEHIRPRNLLLGSFADLANPIYRQFVGCNLYRRTPDLLRSSGFEVFVLEHAMAGIFVALIAEPLGTVPAGA